MAAPDDEIPAFSADLTTKNAHRTSTASLDDGGPALSWEGTDERKVLRKLDCYLLVLLTCGFFAMQLDRSNISNALSDTLTEDLGISKDDVNFGNQLQMIGIIVAEIPSNLLLQKLGAPIWLTGQVLLWGSVAFAQAWVTGKSSFYATRFLLGLLEGGYVPGGQYMLALFYRKRELALRTAVFYFGNYIATATGSLIAAGLLKMAGLQGMSGWQWLFLVEGCFTFVIFIAFVLLLPRSPTHTRPIHGGFDLFTEKEKLIMTHRIAFDDDTRSEERARITLKSFCEAVTDYHLWMHLVLNVVALAPKGGLQLYGPTIIKTLGFGTIDANLLNSVSSFLVVIFSFCIALASDKTKLRGPWCIFASVYALIFAGAVFATTGSPKWTRYGLFTMLAAGNALTQGLNDAWLNINAATPTKRSIGLAFVVIGSQLGGLSGQQLFRSSDAPEYTHGFMAIMILYAASILVILGIMSVYWRDNRKALRAQGQELRSKKEGCFGRFQL